MSDMYLRKEKEHNKKFIEEDMENEANKIECSQGIIKEDGKI